MSKEDTIKRLKEENRQRRIDAYTYLSSGVDAHVTIWREIRLYDRYIRWAEENWED